MSPARFPCAKMLNFIQLIEKKQVICKYIKSIEKQWRNVE